MLNWPWAVRGIGRGGLFFRRIARQRPGLVGAGLVFASAATVSVTFIASKEAMKSLSPLAFSPVWFGVASAWGVGFYVWGNGWRLPPSVRVAIRPLLLLGILNGIANFLLFIGINLGDPTLAAFFSRSETIYTVWLGAWLLGERMRGYQWVGAGVAIIGAGVMTFRAGLVVWLMLLTLLVSNFFLALSAVVAKREVFTVPPLTLSTARTIIMSLLLGLIGLGVDGLAWPDRTAWLWIIGGSFFGPFLSYLFFYRGLQYMSLAKGAVIRATQPLFVALYSLLLFGTVITGQQFLGGLIMLAGVILMLWERE